MTHFLDTIVGQRFDNFIHLADLVAEVSRAECILADNVFRYWHEIARMDEQRVKILGEVYVTPNDPATRYAVDLKTFPTIVPPFESTFVTGHSFGSAAGKQGGILFVRRAIRDQQPECFSYYLNEPDIWSSRLDMERSGVRWLVYMLPFVQNLRGIIIPPYSVGIYPVDADGRWFRDRRDQPAWLKEFKDDDAIKRDYPNSDPNSLPWEWMHHKAFHDCAWPALLTLCLIHCRNVEVIEHDPTPTRQLRKQSQRRQEQTGFPLIRFRTVEIEPIKRVLREEGRISEVGLAQALHICRGHFKDYREGEGLFGKHHEVYWWNDHRRGTIEQGAILKDYRAPLDS